MTEAAESKVVPTEIKELTQELLVEHGMNYKIVSIPDTLIFNDQPVKSSYWNLINTKTMEKINSVKKGYTISQTEDVLEMVLLGMKDFPGLEVERFDDLHGGRKSFIQLKIEGDGLIPRPDGTFDTITRYITILDSNDGTSSLSIGIGDKTASCSNQFFKFYKEGQLKFRHSASITEKIKDIPTLLELAMSNSIQMIELYKSFESTKITRSLAQNGIVKELLGYNRLSEDITGRAQNNMDTLYSELDAEMDDKGNNLWGLHSGVTSWTTHTKQAPKRRHGREESALVSTNYKVNQKSLEYVTKRYEELVSF